LLSFLHFQYHSPFPIYLLLYSPIIPFYIFRRSV
jgi:hypothetical protein